MIARYIKKNGYYYCSNCMMRANEELEPFCKFCGAEMTNLENILIEIYKDRTLDSSLKL